jgi:glucose-6-phosphate 1-epimerase
VAALNKAHGIPGSVEVTTGRGGLPIVRLTSASGAAAEVYLFGGAVNSWTQPSGDEVLYVRPDAVFDKSKPISGGIPHCFPQFGPGPLPQHGFARGADWGIGSTSADPNPDEVDPSVELILSDTDATRAVWPHAFRAAYRVTLHGEALRTELAISNTGASPFTFTAALHTYIEVSDIRAAKVSGLKGLTWLDKTADPANPPRALETRDAVPFAGPVDAVYLGAPGHLELDVGTGAAVAIDSAGWPDAVVWSPWDAMPACYERFCCVENAVAVEPVTVEAGKVWKATADFAVIDLA